jgi:hypothetical protein
MTTPDRLVLAHRARGELAIAVLATIVFAVIGGLVFARGNDAGVLFLIFAVSGPVYLYFFYETREAVFDRAGGQVTFTRRTPRGTEQAQRPLAGLARAAVHRATAARDKREIDPDAPPPGAGSFRAVLLWTDGTELPLSDAYSRGLSAIEEARAINAWLATG